VITFSANALNAPSAWSWDFDGGTIPETSTDASPQVTLKSGSYTGTVIASNAAGASAPFEFSFDASPISPMNFSTISIAGTPHMQPNVFILDGRATIIYSLRPSTNGAVMFRRARDPIPGFAWDEHTISTKTFIPSKVILYEDRVAFIGTPRSSLNPPNMVRLIYALTDVPTSATDWREIGTPVDQEWISNRIDARVGAAAGRFAFCATEDDAIWFAQSTVMWPLSELDFTLITIPLTNGLEQVPDTVEIDGRPNIFYGDTAGTGGYFIKRATTPYPTQATDFITYPIMTDEFNSTTYNFALAVAPNGVPVAAFTGQSVGVGEYIKLRVSVATSTHPLGTADWTTHAVGPAYGFTTACTTTLAFTSDSIPLVTLMTRDADAPFALSAATALADRAAPTDPSHWVLVNAGEFVGDSDLAISGAFLPNDTPLIAWGQGGDGGGLVENPVLLGVGDRPW